MLLTCFFVVQFPSLNGKMESVYGQTRNSKVNINTASIEELMKLPGVGAKRSAAIVQGRPFKSLEELVSKKIMPPELFAVVKDQISL